MNILKNPLTAAALDALLAARSSGNPRRRARVNMVLQRLSSVISINAGEDKVIRVIHASFSDFLTSRDRCTDTRFFVDALAHDAHLASCSFSVMDNLAKVCDDLGLQPSLFDRPTLAVGKSF